MAQAGPRCQLV